MPTLSQLYQSRSKSDQRNKPRSQNFNFWQKGADKRQWWSEGAYSTTRNTTATSSANFGSGSKLQSIPLRYQTSRTTTTTTTTEGSRSRQSSSLLRPGAPSTLLTGSSQTGSRKLSWGTRFAASRSTLSPGARVATTSQDRSPPITLTNVTTRGTTEETYLPGTMDGEQLSASPPAGWPFTNPISRTLPDRALTASREPLHGHGHATSSGSFSMAPGDVESGARPYIDVDEIQAAPSPRYDK